jgi:hypothetical protein
MTERIAFFRDDGGYRSRYRPFHEAPRPPQGGGDGRVTAGCTFANPLAAAKKIFAATKSVGE